MATKPKRSSRKPCRAFVPATAPSSEDRSRYLDSGSGHGSAKGLARDLLVTVLESGHVLLLADEMLFELAKVLRYPRMMALHVLSEGAIFHYIGFLRHFAEIVRPDPLLFIPIRDLNDTIVMQTAIIGDADVICTRDQDFFCPPAEPFLRRAGIEVLDDITLMRRLRH